MKKEINTTKNTCKVTFTLPPEAIGEANTVAVLGDFSEWNPVHLLAGNDGSFELTLEIPVGRDYHFRYLIDDYRWENDWAADRYEISPAYDHVYNSILSLVEFEVKEKPKKEAKKAEPSKKEVSPKKAEAPKKAETTPKEVSAKKAETPKKEAAKEKAAEDDLTKIEGIGPKIADLLKADGIATFEALSKTSEANLQAILDKAGKRYNIHKPATWAAQAALAAKGDWTALKKWQDELTGGKA